MKQALGKEQTVKLDYSNKSWFLLSLETQEDESGVAEVRQDIRLGPFGDGEVESMIFYNVEFDPGSG